MKESRAATITQPRPNDVLMGRGMGASLYIGNKSFLEVVQSRKAEYNQTASYKEKAVIAKEVFEVIQSRGGRFLTLLNPTKGARNVVKDGIWQLGDEKDALEKCKQALRQQRNKGTKKSSKTPSVSEKATKGKPNQEKEVKEKSIPPLKKNELKNQDDQSDVVCLNLPDDFSIKSDSELLLDLESLAHDMPEDEFLSAALDGDLEESTVTHTSRAEDKLHQSRTFQPVPNLIQQVSVPFVSSAKEEPPIHPNQLDAIIVDCCSDLVVVADPDSSFTASSRSSFSSSSESVETAVQDHGPEHEALACLSIAGMPAFTKEQYEKEQAQLTQEERLAATSDLLGQLHLAQPRKPKRAKRDLNKEFQDSMIHQMRQQLQAIPASEKQALANAEANCLHPVLEFGDERLAKFLQCEGMNPELAARRFVAYWEARLEVFGPVKFLMRMSLSEALRDDLAAIEDNVACILPHLDTAGRQLFYIDPHRRSPEKYSSQSLLRALWYTMEMACSKETEVVQKGYVSVAWLTTSTIWDFDRYVYTRIPAYQDKCFPIPRAGSHDCCPNSISMRIIAPMIQALVDKETRLRSLYHTCPADQVLPTLAEYGILPHMLPTDMGGTVQLAKPL